MLLALGVARLKYKASFKELRPSPLPAFRRPLPEQRDWLPESAQTRLHLGVVRGHVDLPRPLPALELRQHLRLSLADVVFQIERLACPGKQRQGSEYGNATLASVLTAGVTVLRAAWSFPVPDSGNVLPTRDLLTMIQLHSAGLGTPTASQFEFLQVLQ